ncbi:hypothetical protein BJ508DRAFT_366616 [Ascobolus immersus RN42]|uniref:Uncharacterized protein n=1 Tax=Ascobolus immersus RN42 TaxID=1160509 RepID=A0A3N4HP70_ASCIM|nr:hypothetical protein BJ508DRAFT_366616 [Ascobolus immersus RN42]
MAAAESGNSALVIELLQSGATVTAEMSTGETALHFAVASFNSKIVRQLLAAGAPLNARIRHAEGNFTPIIYHLWLMLNSAPAVWQNASQLFGYEKMALLLLSHGAELEVTSTSACRVFTRLSLSLFAEWAEHSMSAISASVLLRLAAKFVDKGFGQSMKWGQFQLEFKWALQGTRAWLKRSESEENVTRRKPDFVKEVHGILVALCKKLCGEGRLLSLTRDGGDTSLKQLGEAWDGFISSTIRMKKVASPDAELFFEKCCWKNAVLAGIVTALSDSVDHKDTFKIDQKALSKCLDALMCSWNASISNFDGPLNDIMGQASYMEEGVSTIFLLIRQFKFDARARDSDTRQELLAWFLRKGGSRFIESTNSEALTPLLDCIRIGSYACSQLILENGASVLANLDGNNWGALDWARVYKARAVQLSTVEQSRAANVIPTFQSTHSSYLCLRDLIIDYQKIIDLVEGHERSENHKALLSATTRSQSVSQAQTLPNGGENNSTDGGLTPASYGNGDNGTSLGRRDASSPVASNFNVTLSESKLRPPILPMPAPSRAPWEPLPKRTGLLHLLDMNYCVTGSRNSESRSGQGTQLQ